jgi:hypothetical protein
MSTLSSSSAALSPTVTQAIRRLASHRIVQVTVLAWAGVNILAALFFADIGVIDRPLYEGQSIGQQLAIANIALIEVLVLAGIVVWLTRHRLQPALSALPLPSAGMVRYETVLLAAWGVLAIFGGIILGQALDTAPIGFHLTGTLFGAHDHDVVTRQVALIWAGYNLAVYAVLPWLYVRRRHGPQGMPLRSIVRRGDLIVILVVLAIEAAAQLTAISAAILDLEMRQLALGLPLTFALYAAGTVLPTVIFVQALLVPRFLAITGSVPATVVLGGLAYTAVHVSDSWAVMTSPGNALLSGCLLLLTYFGPGLIKTLMTVRTGNAWVHAWAYHAFAPHTLIDTPLIVRIFGL